MKNSEYKIVKKNYFQPKTRFHSISLYISVIYRTPYPQFEVQLPYYTIAT